MQHWRWWVGLIVGIVTVVIAWRAVAAPPPSGFLRTISTVGSLLIVLPTSLPLPAPISPATPGRLPTVVPSPTASAPSAPVLDVLPPPTPTVVNPAGDAALAALSPFCGQGRQRTRSCGLPLAIQLALDLKHHPAQPQALERYRQLMEIPDAERAWDAPPSWDLDVSWAIPAWLHTEMQARYPLPVPYTTGQNPIPIGRVTMLPTDLDGDGSEDYLLTTSISWRQEGAYWFRWQDDQWQLTSQWTYAVEAGWAGPRVGDVTGDAQPDLLILEVHCGSACSEGLRALTWRAGAWISVLPIGAGSSEWELRPQEDGTLEVRSREPWWVWLRYTFDGTYLAPTAVVPPSPTATTGELMEHAHAFLSIHDLAATQTLLEQALLAKDSSAITGRHEQVDDARPLALFRLGAAQLLHEQRVAAHASWDRLVATDPDSPAAGVVRTLALTRTDESAVAWCTRLRAAPAQLGAPDERVEVNAALGWRSLCTPRMQVPLQVWTQEQALGAQFAAVGLPWQELSAAYDLNGDGVPDPIGLTDWLHESSVWAMLSEADRYQPLNMAYRWGLAHPLAAVAPRTWGYIKPGMVPLVTDLDANGRPEVTTLDSTGTIIVAEWDGVRFGQSFMQTSQQWGIFPYTPTLVPQPDGTVQVVAALQPTACCEPDVPHMVFVFRNGALMQVDPPPFDPGAAVVLANEVLTELFLHNDPDQALALLDRGPLYEADDPWSAHQWAVLRAIVLSEAGRSAEAQSILQGVAGALPATGWTQLAQELSR